MLQDLRFALRSLRTNPAFSITAIVALALGIGANAAIFTIVNSVLLRPLAFPEPGRLFVIYSSQPNPQSGFAPRYGMIPDPDFIELRNQTESFEKISSLTAGPTSLTGIGEPIPVKGWDVTADFWPALGTGAALGRTFVPEEEAASRNQVVVLSDTLWRSHFGADRSVLGKTVKLDGQPHTIIGVMPPGFGFPAVAELWRPLLLSPDPGNVWSRRVIGRLKSGVGPAQAEAEMQTLAARLVRQFPESHRAWSLHIISIQDFVVDKVRLALLVLMGAVGFIVLIACANVANLVMARGSSRSQEIAIRASLGASRTRLIRQLLTESALLSLLGGAAGFLLSAWGVAALVAVIPAGLIPRTGEIGVGGTVLLFTLGMSLATSLLFGILPALQTSGVRLGENLKQGLTRSFTPGRRLGRNALVVAEIALALVLLAGAGLMLKSFLLLRSVDPGFRPGNVLITTVNLPPDSYRTTQQSLAFHRAALEKLSLLPGVQSVAAVNWLPLDQILIRGTFRAEGQPDSSTRFLVSKPGVSPDYFKTMGIRLVRGREFNDRDTEQSPGVAILSQAVVRRAFPNEDAIGKRITLEDHPKPRDWLTVVGIVEDVKQLSLAEKSSPPAIYQPLTQVVRPFFLAHMTYLLRTDSNAQALAGLIRQRVHEVDSQQPIQLIAPLDDLVNASVAEPRFYSGMLGLFAGIAVLLASIGTYGVMAYSVSQRTREIGIRVALGAESSDIFSSVLGHSLVLVCAGVAIGLAGAFGLTRVLRGLLFEVKPTDPATLVIVSLLLALTAMLASYIPARRAAKVDPLVALRYE